MSFYTYGCLCHIETAYYRGAIIVLCRMGNRPLTKVQERRLTECLALLGAISATVDNRVQFDKCTLTFYPQNK